MDGSLICNLHRRLERWVEHFTLQFNWPSAPTCSSEPSALAPWSVTTEPPTEAEIRKEIQVLKRHKAAGLDDLSPALFKDGGECLVRELTILFSRVWCEERMPPSWGESIVVPIFKKGCRNICSNHRGISLIPTASKILASVVLRRLSPKREEQIREEQAGFRAGRGCIDQITLRQLLEHRHTYRRPTVCCVLGHQGWLLILLIELSYGTVCLDLGVPEKYVSILKAVYSQTSGKVSAYGELSPSFAVTSSVRQGCPISSISLQLCH